MTLPTRRRVAPPAVVRRALMRRGGAASPPAPRRAVDPEAEQRVRVANIRAQVDQLAAFCGAQPLFSLDGPEPMDRVWARGRPVEVTVRGFPAPFETSDGTLGQRADHPLLCVFGPNFPFNSSDLTFYYNWRKAGGVVFHPNVRPVFACPPGKQAGYVCLFARPPAGLNLVRGLLQFVELIALRAHNLSDQDRLNPRAAEALEQGRLTPLCTRRPTLAPVAEPGGDPAERVS